MARPTRRPNDCGSDRFGRIRLRTPALMLGSIFFLLLGTGRGSAVWPVDQLFAETPVEERAASLLQEAIRIPTVNPPGNEAALARLLAAELGRAGLESGIVATPGPDGGPPRAAVWGRLRGSGKRPGIALLSHLDTVPADAKEWSVEPFEGERRDGYVWGRGALDSKGVVVAHLMTLLELAADDTKLERDVVFLATPEEETGGRLGAGWIAEHHPELVEGVGYLLTEGGGIQAAPSVGPEAPAIWGVALTEKAPCWLELKARGRGGHSSAPTPDAAVPRLIAALDRIRRAESPVQVSAIVETMFAKLAPFASEWDREGFLDLSHALEEDDAFRRRFLEQPHQNALVRNTVSITVLEGAPKTNVAPALARAELDARLLPGESCEAFSEALAILVDDPAIEIEPLLSFSTRASTTDSALYRAIEKVAAGQNTDSIVVPRMIGGFTDAHWFRDLGIVSYGFVPRTLRGEEARRIHGIDERVAVSTLGASIELMLEIVKTLDSIDSAD